MPASQASDDADASMLDDATSTSSADILAADLSDSNQPTTPIHAHHTSSQFSSEPTPPHTGADIRNTVATISSSSATTSTLPSLNANGKRALPSSATDLRSPAVVDALGNVVSSEFESSVPPAAGMKWTAGDDGILVEMPDNESAAATAAGASRQQPGQQDEPGAKWMNKKAQDEMRKAMDQIVDREYMIKKKYGDVVLDPRSQTARS